MYTSNFYVLRWKSSELVIGRMQKKKIPSTRPIAKIILSFQLHRAATIGIVGLIRSSLTVFYYKSLSARWRCRRMSCQHFSRDGAVVVGRVANIFYEMTQSLQNLVLHNVIPYYSIT